jgi:hypothetical protein
MTANYGPQEELALEVQDLRERVKMLEKAIDAAKKLIRAGSRPTPAMMEVYQKALAALGR